MSKYKYKYKRIDPILKMKPHCCRCAIILSNTEPYNTSTIDPQWCDECYQKIYITDKEWEQCKEDKLIEEADDAIKSELEGLDSEDKD